MEKKLRISKPVRVLIAVAALIVIVYVAAAVTFSSNWFHGIVARRIESSISQSTGARVAIKNLTLRPLILQVHIHGLTLYGSNVAGPPLLSVRDVVIRINPASLWLWKLRISRLDVDGAAANIVTYPDGETNIPGPPASAGSPSKLMDFSVGELVVAQSVLSWNDQKIPIQIAAKNAGILLYQVGKDHYSGSFFAAPIQAERRGEALPPVNVASRIEITRGGIALRQFVWRAAGLTGHAEASVQWPRSNVGAVGSASIDFTGNLTPLAKALRLKTIPEGAVSGHVLAGLANGKVSAKGSISASQVSVHMAQFNPGLIDASSDFTANTAGVELTHLRVRALGGVFNGKGSAQIKTGAPYQFALQGSLAGGNSARALRMTPQGAEIERLLALAPSSVSGKAAASWKGSFNGFRARFDLAAAPPAAIPVGERPLSAVVQGSLSAGPGLIFTFDKADFSTLHSHFSARGQLGGLQISRVENQPTNLTVQYTTTDASEAQPLVDAVCGLSSEVPLTLHSTAAFSGAVAGTLRAPEVQGSLTVGAFTLRGWAWHSLQAEVRASPSGVAVEHAVVRSGSSSFNFSGSAALADWKVEPGSQLSVSAHAIQSPLKGLEEAFGVNYPLSGVISGAVAARGTSSTLSGQGNFKITRGSLDGEPFDSFSSDIKIAESQLSFENVALHKNQGLMTGSIQLNLPARSFSMQFQGEQFSLTDFALLRKFEARNAKSTTAEETLPAGKLLPETGDNEPAQQGIPPPLSGMLSFSANGHGTLGNPVLNAQLRVRQLEVAGSSAGDAAAALSISGKQLKSDINLSGRDGSIKLGLAAAMSGDWPAQFNGAFSNLRLDLLPAAAGHSPLGAPVIAAGTLTGSGPLRLPRQLSFQARASSLDIRIPGLPVQNAGPVDVRYANGEIESNHFEMRGPATQLSVHLSAELAAPAQMSLDISGNAQASLLRIVDPSLEAAGSFTLNLHESGPVASPALSGQLGVHNLSVRYGSLPLPLSDLNGSIALSGNRATIQSLREETGQTSLDVSGYATLGAVPTLALQAKFQHVRLEYPADFTSILSGNISLTGSTESARLAGNVTVNEMFVSQDFNLINWLGSTGISLEIAPEEAAPGAPAGIASKVRLDVRVATDPTVRLNSQQLSFVATIEARLQGTLERPVATGNIHLRDGEARIAGSTYRIARGNIAMTNPYRTTPILDIGAQTRVERYDVTIEVSGPVDNVKMSYRSDPPLPPEQILSLLALGYAPQQALMSSSGAQRMGAVGAGSLLTTALSSQVSGRFQKLFGVSRIRIDPNLLGPTSAGGARVTVEEQVARNFTITYSTNTAAAQQRDIRLQWDVSSKISLIGERDINGVYGFEIRFRKRLR